ncbi:hypothetical protein FGO68_gene3150 [Halteria grandinella]|uniref:Basic immunoglobulin-like variable motif-containing protein n=1 Tax=Halteria grandinella TaxID=5974 RepID=A0A8J8NCX1_HALGN|nr:hypothetical protein FGO68_gene3150 [Halteria grandinella]
MEASQDQVLNEQLQKLSLAEEIVDKPFTSSQESTDLQPEKQESVLLDFSNTFKQGTRGFTKKGKQKGTKAPTLDQDLNQIIDPDEQQNRDLEDENLLLQPDVAVAVEEIPRNLTITQDQMALRKQLDLKRWFCIARPQHPKSCGISSLTSVWNYLFSTLGVGTHNPISTEEALEVLGFKPPYQSVQFGSFTGNDTLIQWFGLLNKYYKLGQSSKGGAGSTLINNTLPSARILWKAKGKSTTPDVDADQARKLLIEGLRDPRKAYIYHCWNHYFCPIGFELTPNHPYEAYTNRGDDSLMDPQQFETWIIIGEVSKCYPTFHVKKWTDIATDIECGFPQFFNIRKSEFGVQEKTTPSFVEGGSKLGGNLHCIIEFSSGIHS